MEEERVEAETPLEDAAGEEGEQSPLGQSPGEEAAAGGRIQANKHRRVQLARTDGRKLFDEAAQQVFLEWFAATCNVSLSAEKAGFNYKTVLRHRMNDPRFAEGWQRAVEQAYARLEAKQLETKAKETPIGIEGDWDAPEMEEMDPERAERLLALHRKEAKSPETMRRQGRRPRIASNAEVREALSKRLKAYRDRVRSAPGKPGLCPGVGRGPAGERSADEGQTAGDAEAEFPGEMMGLRCPPDSAMGAPSWGPADEGSGGELDPGLRRGTDSIGEQDQ